MVVALDLVWREESSRSLLLQMFLVDMIMAHLVKDEWYLINQLSSQPFSEWKDEHPGVNICPKKSETVYAPIWGILKLSVLLNQ